ncbi:MAG: hypothetical protein CO189_11710 [candidate division Zixibacteria bacterium CG_4_9_14_3_um_filter_46_8]|nr:MAG: hypothetical protein CO189_11710 [candidate division Zixibacteria bacterium CG_4_9_14_3_um_filter_46_8]
MIYLRIAAPSITIYNGVKMGEPVKTRGKILVIDDEPEITDIIEAYMTSAGFSVMVENSSVMGVERAKTYKPDMILLDIMMPHMDGYEVCSEMRKNESTKSIPILFLTGKDANDDAGKSWDSGANMFVKKPFSCERLLNVVNMVMATVSRQSTNELPEYPRKDRRS